MKALYGVHSLKTMVYCVNVDVINFYLELKNVSLRQDRFDVHMKNDVPEHLFFQSSSRIPPVIAFAKPGYYISDTKWTLKGNHGYDPTLSQEMTAIFVAYGPSFESCPDNPFGKFPGGANREVGAKKCKWDTFDNTAVHPILCKLLFSDPDACIKVNDIYKQDYGKPSFDY